jgi:hypothetical protein
MIGRIGAARRVHQHIVQGTGVGGDGGQRRGGFQVLIDGDQQGIGILEAMHHRVSSPSAGEVSTGGPQALTPAEAGGHAAILPSIVSLILTLANGTAMTREESSPPKKPRNRARASVEGDGAVAQGKGALAQGEGASYVGGDSYQITLQQAAQPGASAGDLRQGYLAWLSMQANRLPLFVSDSGKQVQLASVYTALLTEGRDEKRLNPAAGGSLRQPGTGQPGEVERLERLSALEALDRERHLVLMGGPGSGKTTFLNFVVLCLAGEILRAPGANLQLLRRPIPPEEGALTEEPQPKPKPQRWRHGALLPVRVVLRDFAASLPPPGTPAGANDLWTFIVGQLPASAAGATPTTCQAELLGQGGLILLDGLDEVPDALQRREQVKTAVQEFAATTADAASWSPAAPTPISARTGSSTASPSASCCPSPAVRSSASSTAGISTWRTTSTASARRRPRPARRCSSARPAPRTARARRATAAADPDGAAADPGRWLAAGKPRGTVPPVGGHAARRMGRPQTAA